jgi:hypothetical protein
MGVCGGVLRGPVCMVGKIIKRELKGVLHGGPEVTATSFGVE